MLSRICHASSSTDATNPTSLSKAKITNRHRALEEEDKIILEPDGVAL